MEADLKKIQNKLKKALSEERYEHTMGVMYTAASVAMAHGADLRQAQYAGLLHDCAKCIPHKKQLTLCQEAGVQISDFERNHLFLLHAKLGAYLAENTYGIHDPEILESIRWHTTGKAGMTVLEKIIYIADYIEPNRDKAPHLSRIRRLAFEDLDACMLEILSDTVTYLSNDPASMDPTTLEAYEYYKNHRKNEYAKEGTL